MRDATGLTEVNEAKEVKDDRLARLLRLILPNGIPPNFFEGGEQHHSKKSKQTEYSVSQELPELELELAITAVGIMWPLNSQEVHSKSKVQILLNLLFVIHVHESAFLP